MASRHRWNRILFAAVAAVGVAAGGEPAGAQQPPAPDAPAYRIPLKQARIPEGILAGSLTGPRGAVPGATLTAQPAQPGAALLSIPLDAATGAFEVKLPPGKYTLEGTATGHTKLQVEIEVRDKYRVKVPLQLKPAAPPLPVAAPAPTAPGQPAPSSTAATAPPAAQKLAEAVAIRYDQDSTIGAEVDESQVTKLPLKDKISFGPDELLVPGSANALLDKLAALLQKNNALVRIEVNGYAGPGGKGDLDQRNSLRRATYVKNYLVEKGVAPARVRIQGLGAKPGEKGRADQVEFVLWQLKQK